MESGGAARPRRVETIGGHVVNVALNVLSAERPAPGWRMAGIDVSAPRGRRPIRATEKAALLRGESLERAVPETIRETAVDRPGGDDLADDADRRLGAARAEHESAEEEPGAAGGISVEAAPDPIREHAVDRAAGGRAANSADRLVGLAQPADLVGGEGAVVGGESARAASAARADNGSRADSARPLGTVTIALQRHQIENPDAVITTERVSGRLLGDIAFAAQGLKTGDDDKWRRMVWEIPSLDERWRYLQSTVEQTTHYGGRTGVIDWETKGEGLARLQGMKVWGSEGVAVGLMSKKPVTLYSGEVFDGNVAPVVPKNDEYLSGLVCFFESGSFSSSISRINRHLKIDAGTVVRAPFDLDHWQQVAAEKYPNGLPEPYTDDPTQWIFHGHPCGSVVWDEEAKRTAHGPLRIDAVALQVAVARLVGYRWPAERDPDMRLADEMRTWIERCRALDGFADPDGIVCLPAVAGEPAAADRLRRLLAAAYGPDWSAVVERRLLAAAAGDARPADSLEAWLRDRFFAEHCRRFHHRPFVWHVWDGRRDGFSALVNYHRLVAPDGAGRRTLEALTYSCVGDWIARQEADQRDGREGADGRLAAALDLRQQFERILEGEPPCDLFVRWKPLAEQPVGWTPDSNDGVRLNLRPFLSAELAHGGRVGAGVLRWKPNVAWGKDRGKEPTTLRPATSSLGAGAAPAVVHWTSGSTSREERSSTATAGTTWHYTSAVKCAARAAASSGKPAFAASVEV